MNNTQNAAAMLGARSWKKRKAGKTKEQVSKMMSAIAKKRYEKVDKVTV